MRQMQMMRSESFNALLRLEAERLLSVRNYAEHLLQIQEASPVRPDADLRAAFARRNDAVWSVASRDAAAVYGVGADRMPSMPGFARRDAELIDEMRVARALSHLLSAAPQGSGIRRHIFWLSTNGLVVSSPSIPEQEVDAVLHRHTAAGYFQDNLPSRNPERTLQWTVASATSEPRDISLFLSVPVYSGKAFRAVAILEIPRRDLDDYLGSAPYHDVSSYVVDRSGKLVGASVRNVRRGETLFSALSGQWTPATIAAIFGADSGTLGDESGHQILFRRIAHGDLAMIDEFSTRDLTLAGATRLSGTVGAGALALGILLCVTLAVVHTLFRHYLARGEALRTLAETDSLTGLANRRVFAARFAAEYTRCGQDNLPLSAIMLDIDHFKKINDRWGHASGDVVLCAVSALLTDNVRQGDLPARLGGEEFAILLPGTSLGDAAAVAEKLRKMMQALRCEPAADASHQETIRFTASFGVADVMADDAAGLDALLMVADHRLYAAKTGGRNQVVAGASKRPYVPWDVTHLAAKRAFHIGQGNSVPQRSFLCRTRSPGTGGRSPIIKGALCDTLYGEEQNHFRPAKKNSLLSRPFIREHRSTSHGVYGRPAPYADICKSPSRLMGHVAKTIRTYHHSSEIEQ